MTNYQPSCLTCHARLDSVFNSLNEEELKALTANKSCSHYEKGQRLFNEGGIPFGLMCVNQGKIKLTTHGPDGKEQILRLAKEGEAIGYRAILTNERYNSTAIALEDCNICIIDRAFFMSQVTENKKLMFEVLGKLNNRHKTAEDQIVSMSQKRVRERMAEALLFLKATYGFEEDNQTINIKLSREELADYVGTSTESSIRLLSDFGKEGLIELRGKKIAILDDATLTKISRIED